MTSTHEKVGDAPAGKPAGQAAGPDPRGDGAAPAGAPCAPNVPNTPEPPNEEPGCLAPGGAAALVEGALRLVGGRWKLGILFRLYARPVRRFSDLERALPGVSQKMLTQQLRELERDGLVARTVHPEVPPRVEYQLTAVGEALRPALLELRLWAALRRDGSSGG